MAKKRKKIDHNQCDVYIKEIYPQTGLYCQQHDHWIKWLSKAEIEIVRQMDLPWVKFGVRKKDAKNPC